MSEPNLSEPNPTARIVPLPGRQDIPRRLPASVPPYAELMVTSNFSFLRGGSHPEELILAATALGLSGLGLCDRNSFAGVVRAFATLKTLQKDHPDFRYVVGVRLVFCDGTPDIIAYPRDRQAYGRLCKLLTIGNMRGQKGQCLLRFEDLAPHAQGQLFIVQADETDWDQSEAVLERLAALAPRRVWLAAYWTFKGNDRARLNRLAAMAGRTGIKLIAVNDVLYHGPERRILQDVVTCIREHVTLNGAGRLLEQNAERHLKPPLEMAQLFADFPDAIAQTQKLIKRIGFDLGQLRYIYPEETVGTGETAQQTLRRLAWEGARRRYPDKVPYRVKRGLVHELALIETKQYAPYFLTVNDLVRFARDERNILCQGRGSAANSTVCFCLGITAVNPMEIDLLFERFVSTERDEPPDIDIDFEHERREEVMQYIYEKYGRDRAGLTATVITYRSKGALREVCKVFGVSADTVAAINELGWGYYARTPEAKKIKDLGIDPADPVIGKVLAVVNDLIGFPRHLSQHVGGFVITRDKLDHLIPVTRAAMENRTVVEWNKDDLDVLGILKVDVLALGMLTCIQKAFDLMESHYGFRPSLAMPPKDERTYKMTHRADTLGVFQIESRAQMSMLPRLKPEKFYDLVIEVAIVRPGPIQGNMVHPYLRRRKGEEEPAYPSEELRQVLEKTLGVPLFQEQAMKIAIVAAGFTPGEADQLRRAMATFRRNGMIANFEKRMIEGMVNKGYPREFAERCFNQIKGFGEYGFPESHAASFAVLVYVSCWLKCHYPDVFACALLNSQPMGFYQPAQIVRDALEHGLEVRPVDVNLSGYDTSLEETGWPVREHIWPRHAEMAEDILTQYALRLGLRFIRGLSQDHARIILDERQRRGPYPSIRALWLRTGLGPNVLEKLAEADAFASMGLDRREALWAVKGLWGTDGAETLPLFQQSGPPAPRLEAPAHLPAMTGGEAVVHDYRMLSLSLKAHPVSFLRPMLDRRRTLRAGTLVDTPAGQRMEVAGLVLVRQRPGTAKGVIFLTLEDETGIANIVIWKKVFDAYRRVLLGSKLLAVRGKVQREGLVVHVVAEQLIDMTAPLVRIANGFDLDEAAAGPSGTGRPGAPPDPGHHRERQLELLAERAHNALPKGRNFQ